MNLKVFTLHLKLNKNKDMNKITKNLASCCKMAMKSILTLSLSLSLISINSLNATEVYKSKAPGMGANQFKQYSMVRSNSNDGFLYSGTTKGPNGQDVIHILKTDDNLATIWSYYYEENPINTLNSTKICKNYDNDGYWISGYHQLGTLKYPFIMEIDNNGIVLQQIELEHSGVFLDVEPTSDDGCIAVGFQSNSLELIANTGRRGLITKFSSTLSVDWARAFHTLTRVNPINDNMFFECAENVTVVGNDYFIMGSVSYFETSYSPPIRVAFGYYCKISSIGTFVYENTIRSEFIPYDAVYDSQNNKVYFVGNFDPRYLTAASVFGEIDEPTGSLTNIYTFEGASGNPFPHVPVPYKIEIVDNELWIFGYVREYFDGINLYGDIMIPFRARINKITMTEIDFYINHTNPVHTNGYPSQDPGFLNAWDNFVNVFEFSPLYVPEMGILYQDDENNNQWAMVGYYNQNNIPPRYDLHLMNSLVQGECNALKRNLSIDPPVQNLFLQCINLTAFETTRNLNISINTMNLNSDNCN